MDIPWILWWCQNMRKSGFILHWHDLESIANAILIASNQVDFREEWKLNKTRPGVKPEPEVSIIKKSSAVVLSLLTSPGETLSFSPGAPEPRDVCALPHQRAHNAVQCQTVGQIILRQLKYLLASHSLHFLNISLILRYVNIYIL